MWNVKCENARHVQNNVTGANNSWILWRAILAKINNICVHQL